jgi:hypothetical protein
MRRLNFLGRTPTSQVRGAQSKECRTSAQQRRGLRFALWRTVLCWGEVQRRTGVVCVPVLILPNRKCLFPLPTEGSRSS